MEIGEIVLTITLSIFGGGALTTLLQFLISRRDEKKGKFKTILNELQKLKDSIGDLKKEIDEDRATNARIRILQFSDDYRHNIIHSKESFDQVHLDIDRYNAYCKTHPDYENSRAVAAIEHIKSIYASCLASDDFLE